MSGVAGTYLGWLALRQPCRSLRRCAVRYPWLLRMAVPPYLMSRAVDDGLAPGGTGALACGAARCSRSGALCLAEHHAAPHDDPGPDGRQLPHGKVVVGQAARLGAALPRRAGAGEVVTTASAMCRRRAGADGDRARGRRGRRVRGGRRAAVSVSGVAAGRAAGRAGDRPALGPLLGRLQGTETEYRERQGVLTARIGDLAGDCGSSPDWAARRLFADAFRRDPRRLREQGYRVGR